MSDTYSDLGMGYESYDPPRTLQKRRRNLEKSISLVSNTYSNSTLILELSNIVLYKCCQIL